MIIAEAIESKWAFSAKVRAYCAIPCKFAIGFHGYDLLGADAWTVTEHSFAAGDTFRLKVRRPFPEQGEVVDTSTILKVEPLPR